MGKIYDLFSRFDYWMKNYNHHGCSHSEEVKDFILCEACIVEWGVSYDEYVALALMAKDNGYSIDWIVPYDTFNYLVGESRRRLQAMHEAL